MAEPDFFREVREKQEAQKGAISYSEYQRRKKEQRSEEYKAEQEFQRKRKKALEEREIKEKFAETTTKAGYTKPTGEAITYKDVVLNKGKGSTKVTYDANKVKEFVKRDISVQNDIGTTREERVKNLAISNVRKAPTTTTVTTYQYQKPKFDFGGYLASITKQKKPEDYYQPQIQRSFLGQETDTNRGIKFDPGFGTYINIKKTAEDVYLEGFGKFFGSPKFFIYDIEKNKYKSDKNIIESYGEFTLLTYYYGGKQLLKTSYDSSFYGVGEEKGFKIPFQKTIKQFYETPIYVITQPKEVSKSLYTDITLRPYKVAGEFGSDIIFFKTAGKFGTEIKNTALRYGKTEIPIEKVSTPEVIYGKETFPYSSSPEETLYLSKKADNVLVTATESSFPEYFTIKGGARGLANKEDIVLYTTPKGKASLYFLNVNNGYSQLSLNPFKNIKETFKIPKILEISGVKEVKRYPESLIQTKGFIESNEFILQQAGKQIAYVTKRSEIGTRGLKGIGQGTKELEIGIPAESDIYRGKSTQYFEYKGKVIPIYESKLLPKKTEITKTNFNEKINPSSSSYKIEYKKYETPYKYFSTSLTSNNLDYSNYIKYGNNVNYRNEITKKNYFGSDYKFISEKTYYTQQKLYKSNNKTIYPIKNYESIKPIYSVKINEPIKPIYHSTKFIGQTKPYKINPSKINFSRQSKTFIPFTFPKSERKITLYKSVSFPKLTSSKEKYARLVIPDLYSVNITELKTGKEAISPTLTKKIRKQAKGFFSGTSFGFIETEQIRTNKVRL